MGQVDGLIIPRTYNDYFSRSDPQAIHDIVAAYTDDALSTTSELPVQNKIITAYAQPKILETPIEVDHVEETTVEGALGAINYKVKNFTAGVAFKGTRSAYNTAKLIPEGSDGHIPSGALVIITDEGRTYITNGTGSSQTLELVANATFNGSHAEWNALTLAQKAMFNIVNFTDDSPAGGLAIKRVWSNPSSTALTAGNITFDEEIPNACNYIRIIYFHTSSSLKEVRDFPIGTNETFNLTSFNLDGGQINFSKRSVSNITRSGCTFSGSNYCYIPSGSSPSMSENETTQAVPTEIYAY